MRILRVAQRLYPETTGGGAYHAHAMSRDQVAMGHDVTVATIRTDPDKPAKEERDGYKIHRFDSKISPLGNDIAPGLVRFLRSADDFDVVHAHSHLYFSTNVAAFQRWLGETPLAITNHGLYSQTAPEWMFTLYLHTLGRWTFNRADVVFCYTDTDRERLREYGVNSRIEVVPNGVDTDRFTPEGPESELIDHDGSVVLFVGRLVDGKRPQDAIEAVETLPESLDVMLFVFGDGPLRSELEDTASDRIEFLGSVPYEEMPDVYRAGDVLVLPSRTEGFPRTVLEAIASDVQVVVSNLPQLESVLDSDDRIIEVGDVAGFRQALLMELEEGSEDIRQTVESDFNWEKTVKITTDRLEQL